MLLAPAPADAQIYQWTDGAGVLHYTTDPDRIPEQYRANVRSFDSSRSPESPGPAPEPASLVSLPGGPILVGASVNGVALTLLVDTGADRTMISPAALARAGVEATEGRLVRVVGVGGGVEAREITLARLELAGARLGPVAVVVHDVPAAGADGLLGRDLLDAFTLTVDTAAGRATLIPR